MCIPYTFPYPLMVNSYTYGVRWCAKKLTKTISAQILIRCVHETSLTPIRRAHRYYIMTYLFARYARIWYCWIYMRMWNATDRYGRKHDKVIRRGGVDSEQNSRTSRKKRKKKKCHHDAQYYNVHVINAYILHN